MARATKPKETISDCQDCRHSYDPHSKALDGRMTLCRCPFHTDRSRLMKHDGCDRFQIKH